MGIIESSRKVRDRIFRPIAKPLIKIGIEANMITFLAFTFGLLAVYFIFNNQLLFTLFIILHLFLDGLDGVVARITRTTKFGDYFDHITDQVVGLLLLLKIYFYLNDYFVLIVIFIAAITYVIHFIWTYPAVFTRTPTAIILLFLPLSYFYITNIAYLTAGVFALYSITLQIRTYFS